MNSIHSAPFHYKIIVGAAQILPYKSSLLPIVSAEGKIIRMLKLRVEAESLDKSVLTAGCCVHARS